MVMKDLVIISIYDNGFGFSIMFDGEVLKSNDELFNEIFEVYDSKLLSDFEEYLKEKFKNKTIIICENGGIEVLE